METSVSKTSSKLREHKAGYENDYGRLTTLTRIRKLHAETMPHLVHAIRKHTPLKLRKQSLHTLNLVLLIFTYANPEPQWIQSFSIRLSHLCDIQNAARDRPCPHEQTQIETPSHAIPNHANTIHHNHLPIALGHTLQLILLLDGVRVTASLGSVDELFSQALSD